MDSLYDYGLVLKNSVFISETLSIVLSVKYLTDVLFHISDCSMLIKREEVSPETMVVIRIHYQSTGCDYVAEHTSEAVAIDKQSQCASRGYCTCIQAAWSKG